MSDNEGNTSPLDNVKRAKVGMGEPCQPISYDHIYNGKSKDMKNSSLG